MMRDRLIELISDALKFNIGKSCKLADNIAEHLLENGVIVPPCKKGDLVYELVLCDDEEYRVFDMRVGKVVHYGSTYNGEVWNVYLIGTYTYAYKSFYDFGKTVFLTRDAAEQALKGGVQK